MYKVIIEPKTNEIINNMHTFLKSNNTHILLKIYSENEKGKRQMQ